MCIYRKNILHTAVSTICGFRHLWGSWTISPANKWWLLYFSCSWGSLHAWFCPSSGSSWAAGRRTCSGVGCVHCGLLTSVPGCPSWSPRNACSFCELHLGLPGPPCAASEETAPSFTVSTACLGTSSSPWKQPDFAFGKDSRPSKVASLWMYRCIHRATTPRLQGSVLHGDKCLHSYLVEDRKLTKVSKWSFFQTVQFLNSFTDLKSKLNYKNKTEHRFFSSLIVSARSIISAVEFSLPPFISCLANHYVCFPWCSRFLGLP